MNKFRSSSGLESSKVSKSSDRLEGLDRIEGPDRLESSDGVRIRLNEALKGPLKDLLEKGKGAHVIVEQTPNNRPKIHAEMNLLSHFCT